jgi:hypothetical protein
MLSVRLVQVLSILVQVVAVLDQALLWVALAVQAVQAL